MARMFTYKLHPVGTATFSAEDSQFAGMHGNLLSSPYWRLGQSFHSVCASENDFLQVFCPLVSKCLEVFPSVTLW